MRDKVRKSQKTNRQSKIDSGSKDRLTKRERESQRDRQTRERERERETERQIEGVIKQTKRGRES